MYLSKAESFVVKPTQKNPWVVRFKCGAVKTNQLGLPIKVRSFMIAIVRNFKVFNLAQFNCNARFSTPARCPISLLRAPIT